MNGAEKEFDSSLKGFDLTTLFDVRRVTDGVAGYIDVWSPITAAGAPDVLRVARFFSSVNALWRGRPVTVTFEIEAGDLAGALAGFQAAGDAAARKYIEDLEAQALRTQLASGTPAARSVVGPRLPPKTH